MGYLMRHLASLMTPTLVCLLIAASVHAADYPAKPVRFITPAPAGGGTDLTLRIYAEKLSLHWGQQVSVDNRPGGKSIIASMAVAKAAPDGYTFLGTFDSHATNPAFEDNLPYDTVNDFIPVSMLSTVNMMLAVTPSLPVKSTQELIALAKSKTMDVTYASIGVGSSQYLVAEMFNNATGAGLRHIPYKERSAMTSDVLAGRVQVLVSSIAGLIPYLEAGTLRAVAVTSRQRSAALPDVPTLNEAGVPGYEFISWVGLFAPAKTPRAVINQVNADIKRVASLPDVRDRISKAGADVAPTTPEEFDTVVRADIEKWTRMFKKK